MESGALLYQAAQSHHTVLCVVLLENNRNVKGNWENCAMALSTVIQNSHPRCYLKVHQIFTKRDDGTTPLFEAAQHINPALTGRKVNFNKND